MNHPADRINLWNKEKAEKTSEVTYSLEIIIASQAGEQIKIITSIKKILIPIQV